MNFLPLIFYGLIALFVGGAVVAIDQNGYNRAARKCEAATLKSKLEATEADLQSTQEAVRKANAARVESQEEAAAAQTRIQDYEEVIRKRGTSTCPAITVDDVQRVRGTNTAAKPGSAKSPAGK